MQETFVLLFVSKYALWLYLCIMQICIIMLKLIVRVLYVKKKVVCPWLI